MRTPDRDKPLTSKAARDDALESVAEKKVKNDDCEGNRAFFVRVHGAIVALPLYSFGHSPSDNGIHQTCMLNIFEHSESFSSDSTRRFFMRLDIIVSTHVAAQVRFPVGL